MKRLLSIVGTVLLLLAGPVHSCDGLTVSSAWVREPPPGSTASAAFMTLANLGKQAVTVTGWLARGFGATMLHETVLDGSTARMVMRESLAVAPGAKVELQPGGLHLMLMKPSAPVVAGGTVALVLRCAGGSLALEVPVQREETTR